MVDDSDFGWALGVVFREWQREVHAAAAKLPHGARAFQVLVTLDVAEPPRQGELAAHLGIDRTVLTYLVDDLVKAGLVERVVDARDRRAFRVVLTARGSRRLTGLRSRVAEGERRLLHGLGDDSAQQLRGLVERAAASIHSGTGVHDACRVAAEILADAEEAHAIVATAKP